MKQKEWDNLFSGFVTINEKPIFISHKDTTKQIYNKIKRQIQ